MKILVLNPGGNSLKAELVSCKPQQRYAFEAESLLAVSVENIGHAPQLSVLQNKKPVYSEPIGGKDYKDAANHLLDWLLSNPEHGPSIGEVSYVGIRVVHGGADFNAPTAIDAAVEQKITALEKLAPLHNQSSIALLGPVRRKLPGPPLYAVFDTAFHRTIPAPAALYGIPLELAEKHSIRRYGFHGISHRYLLERYAYLVGKPPAECSLVTTHLENGCSATAIQRGQSVDNTMGLTPLEGLMMGTRSGDIDPSIVSLLMKEEGSSIDEVMTLLNKQSGLLAISGESLDTRTLMKSYAHNPRARLAMDIFAYRVRKGVGALIAALGNAEAVVFGGGIGENSAFVRRVVCEGLRSSGLSLDSTRNETVIDSEGKISCEGSSLSAWVIPTQEGLQIAHECCQALISS